MDSGRRNTHQFSFMRLELKELRKPEALEACPPDFKNRYGKLLIMVNIDLEDGVLNTLIQFYDSAGLKDIPKSHVIGETVHLIKREIDANLVTKGDIIGLPAKFLMEKVAALASVRNTYYSIHHKIEKKKGTIMCCAPLLYKWFISHLSQFNLFKDNKKCLRWSQRIMPLTNANLTWYSRVFDDLKIIDSYGECPNVPLLGTKEGINYNSILARHWLRYGLKDKSSNLLVEGFIIQEGIDSKGLKEKIVNTWRKIHRKGKDELGNKYYVSLEPYTQWMQARAAKIKMPYPP
ncbi:uncharacterized protein LOC127130311 [Lathyrus oleraceus]|uniref:uncharacterized protein LOC127130311 n=1 Tax=Pisum sativum TaxID=3888 RepID=UPI0021D2F8A5|nr:uncharacterized protein LOC127130311 [Pisum sativum]